MKAPKLRPPEFLAMSPDEKRARAKLYPSGAAVEMVERFKDYVTGHHQGYAELDWGHKGQRLSFEDTEIERLVHLLGQLRANPDLPAETGAELLRLMHKYHGLVFGWKDHGTSQYVEGIMAWTYARLNRGDEIDWWLIETDLRGKTMFDLLEHLHRSGFKTADQDFLEKRIERLLG